NDFSLLQIEGKPALIAASQNGIAIHKQADSGFAKVGETYGIGSLNGISAMIDNKGVIHVAAFSEVNSIEFPIYYITYEQNKWELKGSKVEKSLSESWGINNVEIALDDTDTYIFYEMVKWDQRGISAKTLYTVIPLDSENTELNFSRLYLSKADESNSNSYLNEPRTLKVQANEIKLTVVKDTYDKRYGSGFSGYIVTMDKGQIEEITRTTLNQRFITNSTYVNYKGDDIMVYLDAAGSFNYEAFYTETGKSYAENAAKATKDDYLTALMNTLPAYVGTLLLSIVKFLVYFPAILWFLMIEFFEIKNLKERPRLTFVIGIIIYIVIKLIAFGTYYTPLSISQLPPIMSFSGAYYFYAVGIALLSLAIQKLLKKHNPEMNIVLEYIIFAIIDIQITNMLYAAYLL
ncbi:MAG: hypothetical protein K0R84_2106, partial [Clostridia bacterium]|nr:hypothetical protein [Clostridia bacterium]